MGLYDELNRVMKYGTSDADILRKQLATDPEHLKAGSNLRLIAADAHQEAGDEEFADYLRSSFPLAVDGKKVLRSTTRLHRLLTTLHKRHPNLSSVRPEERGAERLADPLTEEAAEELSKLGRHHESDMLRTAHPTTYENGLVRGDYDHFAWPGGSTLVYHTRDGGRLCPECRNGGNSSEAMTADPTDRQWHVDGVFAHDEGPPIHCDHCNSPMVATYGDPDEPEEGDE